MRALSCLFAFLIMVAIGGSTFNRGGSYRRPIPAAPLPAHSSDSGKPVLWEGPDGKVHVVDPKDSASVIDAIASSRSGYDRPYARREPEVNFEPGQPMVDPRGSTPRPYSSRYR